MVDSPFLHRSYEDLTFSLRWNPAAEMQAIDRTHRLGQHKPIYATRFIAKNTIEDRILRLQEKKKLVYTIFSWLFIRFY